MSKGIIKANLGAGQYTVQVEPDRFTGEQILDDIAKQLADIDSTENVDMDLLNMWEQLYFAFMGAVGDYSSAITANVAAWQQSAELKNEIAYRTAELEELQTEASDARTTADQAYQAMLDAYEQYVQGEITWDEFQAALHYYNDMEAQAASLENLVSQRQSELDALQDELDGLEYSDTDGLLGRLSDIAMDLLEIREADNLYMYDRHLEYAVSVVEEISKLTDALIDLYNQIITQNAQNAETTIELQEELDDVTARITELNLEIPQYKQYMDAAEQAYEAAVEQYEAGEITWMELQLYVDAYNAAQETYHLAEFELEEAQAEKREIELQIVAAAPTDPEPVYDDVTTLTELISNAAQRRDQIKRNKHYLELRKDALEKRRDMIQEELDKPDRTRDLWCADYSTDLPEGGIVGVMDIDGVCEAENIRPGYFGAAGYDTYRDGILSPVKIQTPAQAVYNWAMLPGWAKWMPTYRIGTITDIDETGLATVDLDPAESPAQHIKINQSDTLIGVPFKYMDCGAAAFDIDDRVVVQFQDNDWKKPLIIGFEREPRLCPLVLELEYSASDEVYVVMVDTGTGRPIDLTDPDGDPVVWPVPKDDLAWYYEGLQPAGSPGIMSKPLYSRSNWSDDFSAHLVLQQTPGWYPNPVPVCEDADDFVTTVLGSRVIQPNGAATSYGSWSTYEGAGDLAQVAWDEEIIVTEHESDPATHSARVYDDIAIDVTRVRDDYFLIDAGLTGTEPINVCHDGVTNLQECVRRSVGVLLWHRRLYELVPSYDEDGTYLGDVRCGDPMNDLPTPNASWYDSETYHEAQSFHSFGGKLVPDLDAWTPSGESWADVHVQYARTIRIQAGDEQSVGNLDEAIQRYYAEDVPRLIHNLVVPKRYSYGELDAESIFGAPEHPLLQAVDEETYVYSWQSPFMEQPEVFLSLTNQGWPDANGYVTRTYVLAGLTFNEAEYCDKCIVQLATRVHVVATITTHLDVEIITADPGPPDQPWAYNLEIKSTPRHTIDDIHCEYVAHAGMRHIASNDDYNLDTLERHAELEATINWFIETMHARHTIGKDTWQYFLFSVRPKIWERK